MNGGRAGNDRIRVPRRITAGRILAMAALVVGLVVPSVLATTPTAGAMAGVTNNCPAGDISVALYGGSVSRGLVAGSNYLNLAPGFCVQEIPEPDWALMTVAEFQLFEVLWIGNDDCGFGPLASDFATAAATVSTWEAAIDPGSVMVAGGDYDFHYNRSQANAIAVTRAIVTEVAGAGAPGLVLQAGCYAASGQPWFQNIGGSFMGLSHGTVAAGDPTPGDVTAHPFNVTNGFDNVTYSFGASCHGAMAITPGSPAANYNLQTLFSFQGEPCFMLSDPGLPPTFSGDIGGTVWCDNASPNGVVDPGEQLAGIPVALLDSTATTVATSTTLADGSFLFADQLIGTYTVVVDAAALPTTCNSPSVDPDGVLDSMSTVTLRVGTLDNLTQDFGYVLGDSPPATPTPRPTVVAPPAPTPTPIHMSESLTIDKQVVGFASSWPFTFIVSPDVDGCSLTQRLEIPGSGGQIGAAVIERSKTTGAQCTYTVSEVPRDDYVAEISTFSGVVPDGFVRFVNTWTGTVTTQPDEVEPVTVLAHTGPNDELPSVALILAAYGLCLLGCSRLMRRRA